MTKLFGGIEAGGTKFKCIITTEDGRILKEKIIPTSEPEATMQQVLEFFNDDCNNHFSELAAIGIGSFGPLNLEPTSDEYGSITVTPKPGWSHFPC